MMFVLGIVLAGVIASTQGPFYALLFYLWNAYFRPEYWVWNDFIFSLRLSLVIGLILLISSLSSLKDFQWTPRLTLVALFFAQATLSLVVSEFTAWSYPFWLDFAKALLISMLMTVLITDSWRFRLVLWVISWSLAFEAAKQGWAQLVLNPGASNVNTNVMLGDNNGVALGMMMLLPILMALAQTSTSRIERYLHYFVAVGVAYRGISTYSRGGFIAGGVVFVLTLLRSPHKIRTLIATAAIAVMLLSVMPQGFWDRMNTIQATDEDRDSSAKSRLYFWGIAVQMANDHPVTGVGFNAFRYSFPRYDRTGEGMRAVHSIWFGVLADLGYPGLLLFGLITATSIAGCQQIVKRAKRSGMKNLRLFASHLQTCVVTYAIGGTFLSAHYLEFWWHLVALTITLGLVYERELAATATRVPVVQEAVVVSGLPTHIVRPNIPAHLRRKGT
jgi:probable O-glycosylation ligase (exosortase A-associated)